MKKERAIIIKNPRLIRIRNELRMLLKLWVSDVMNSLLQKDRFENGPKFQKEISKLSLMDKLSICTCLHCGNSDKDMIYRPDMKQWLCIDCNSELVYFAKLRMELQMDASVLDEFFQRLSSEEGVGIRNIRHSNIRCGGQSYPLSKEILSRMGVEQGVQDQFLKLCQHYGGHCDCEIVLNAASVFLGE
ncbi:MAG: hypothetical protein HWN80_09365 [Candidatus Lokiarchaeota archaeon]|nr:hypothetical protein [Candidatus Lokiarchaeota archaeon]